MMMKMTIICNKKAIAFNNNMIVKLRDVRLLLFWAKLISAIVIQGTIDQTNHSG